MACLRRGFGTSVGTVFFNPAAGSVLPALVRPDALVAANSGIWTAAVLSQIALAPLAGLAVVTLGFPAGFALNALSYVLSALVLRGLTVPAPPARLERRPLLREAAEGADYLARHPLLRALAGAQLLAALSAGATSALLVVYAREALGVTGSGYGLCCRPSASAPLSARSFCCGLSTHLDDPRSCSGPSPSAASSTSPSLRPAACPSPPARSSATAWPPRPAQ